MKHKKYVSKTLGSEHYPTQFTIVLLVLLSVPPHPTEENACTSSACMSSTLSVHVSVCMQLFSHFRPQGGL